MNNKWLILLMSPLFTYANFENDGWEDQEILDHAVVIEEDSSMMDDYADLYVEAVQDDFEEENELVSAPVMAKKGPKKRISIQSSATSSHKHAKDIRQNSNRPRVTHREREESKAGGSQVDSKDNQFVFQENEVEVQQLNRRSARQAAQQRAERKTAPVLEQETVAEEMQEQRQPARQAASQRTERKAAPVRKQEAVSEEVQVRRQPARQAASQRTERNAAPVRKQEAVSEEVQVRRQPARQAASQRTERNAASVRKQEAVSEEVQVRRQPAKKVAQQRQAYHEEAFDDESSFEEESEVMLHPARKADQQRTSFAEEEYNDEEAYNQEPQVRRQSSRQAKRQSPASSGDSRAQKKLANKSKNGTKKQSVEAKRKLWGSRWAVAPQDYVPVYADQGSAQQMKQVPVKKHSTAISRGQQQAKQQTAQGKEVQKAQRLPQKAGRPMQQRKFAAQSGSGQNRSEKMSQTKAQAPRSYHSGKRPQSE